MRFQHLNRQTNYLQAKFLEDLSRQIHYKERLSSIQELCFQLRFNPKNEGLTHAEIAEQMNAPEMLAGDFNEEGINATVARVTRKVMSTFEEEMVADNVDVNLIEPRQRQGAPRGGDERSPTKLVYRWLWEQKFPRVAWHLSREIAICADEQFQMVEIILRALDISKIPEDSDRQINLGVSYQLKVDLQQEGNLLLIDQDERGDKFLLCPSRAYAPSTQLCSTEAMYLPPKDGDKHRASSLSFNEKGEEYFLAIVTEQPIDLSWVQPDSNPRDIGLDAFRLNEIFTNIGRQGNSRVFYKRFIVIDKNLSSNSRL